MNNITINNNGWMKWALIAAILVIVFLFWRGCVGKSDKDLPPTPDTRPQIDSLNELRKHDTLAYITERDSLAKIVENQQGYIGWIEGVQVSKEDRIKQLTKLITALRKDTGKRYTDITLDNCDSLVGVTNGLLATNGELRAERAKLDALHAQEIALRDTAIADCDVAYLSAVDYAVKANEALSAYKQATRPRASLYIGAVGSSNVLYTVGGLGLLYRGKGGKTIVNGSYSVGNTKPVYGVGIYKRISFRR